MSNDMYLLDLLEQCAPYIRIELRHANWFADNENLMPGGKALAAAEVTKLRELLFKINKLKETK